MTTYEKLTILSLVLATLWPLYQLYLQIFGGTLKVKLTRQIFFRLNDSGESIFLKPVLLAENGSVLIKNVRAKLLRTDSDAIKHWNIEFLQFGEIVRNQDHVLSDHFFYSSSPLTFITNNKPERAVYHGRVEQYAQEVEAIIEDYKSKLNTMRSEIPTAFVPGDESKMKEAFSKLFTQIQETTNELKNKIQLERGSYRVDLTIEYISIGRIIKRNRKSQSSITFKIEKNAHDKIVNNVQGTLLSIGRNWLFNEQNTIFYPEYQPKDVVEL